MLLFYLLLALGISFLCSVLESVILSVSLPFIYLKEKEKHRSAALLKRIKNNIDRPLAAILTLNTIAHTIGAAGVGAEATKIFGEVYFGIVSAVLTLLILVFSEIIPKTVGALYWRSLALPSARLIQAFIIITYPLVILSELITKAFSRGKISGTVSREEIAMLASVGGEEGVFDELETKTIVNLIQLKNLKVKDIMTPRTVITAAREALSAKEFFEHPPFLQFSRIPVYRDNIDQITGYVLKQDILEHLLEDENNKTLLEEKRSIITCYENISIPKLFEKLLVAKEHIALVISEYGGTEGIVTMEDIIETILGLEITDERDTQADMQQLARDRWLQRRKKNTPKK
ncbi:CNNM domain-containing protein [Mangrovibacterium diazotrophicum]|uniref:CBS domain containing-hemolysin-like protein n=1 Tax=Mangrovibacterium diazotrophicum TaxID=1261403 RepID=A0A419WBQ9_9BACT|nr:hemolysin family protein [Mangrovibacterium diazotrophicum]RKD92898.1 CBS domain containing-hemolysin-like protein [Mangrovibacterium diazotrophicum]